MRARGPEDAMTTISDMLDNSEGRRVGEVVRGLLVEASGSGSIDVVTACFKRVLHCG